MKIILLNGPPRSGKDTASLAIESWLDDAHYVAEHEKFSLPNKQAFGAIMQKELDTDFNLEYYEERKTETVPEFGVSYRQWQMDFSEKFMKPLYGNDVFVQLFLKRVEHIRSLLHARHYNGLIFVVSDCGFQVEANTIAASKMFKDILLIRCRRPGCNFEGDSREYIYLDANIEQHDLHNVGSRELWEATCVGSVRKWLDRRMVQDLMQSRGGT